MKGIDQPPAGFGKPESAPEKPLFTLVLMRHEHVDYESADLAKEDPGITQAGAARAEDTGRKLFEDGTLDRGRDLRLAHSPQRRTEETLRAVLRGAGLDEAAIARSIAQLRTADKGENYAESLASGWEIVGEEGGLTPRAWDRIAKKHYDDPLHTTRPDVVETKESRSKRLYRSLEHLIRWQEKNGSAEQVLAVSHFEVIMHLVDDAFGIQNFPTYHLPDFGDYLVIQAFATEDANVTKLRIRFLDREKEIVFDRVRRSLKEME